ncbi:hypothetical protein BconGalA64_65420 [Burkholderia contaminans]|nr:hypothetical protein BconGalA64_65420 [Burkholderia contaminans]
MCIGAGAPVARLRWPVPGANGCIDDGALPHAPSHRAAGACDAARGERAGPFMPASAGPA